MTSGVDLATTAAVEAHAQRRATLLFVRMWAVAHILHLLIADRNALDTPWNIAVVALATSVVLRPQTSSFFAAMLIAQVVEYLVEMPFSPDHWALVSLVNMAVLVTMLVCRSTKVSSLEKALPAARLLLLVAYGAAALSKWNTTFLDPVTSCANAIAKVASFGLIGPLGDSPALSVGAMVVENSVFVLLIIPATRAWGVLLGLAFHLSLSSSPVMVVGDFTSTVYALFLLFLSPVAIVNMLDRLQSWAGKSSIVRDARRRPEVTALVAFVALGFGGYVAAPAATATLYLVEQLYFLSIMVATALGFLATRRGARIGTVRAYHLPILALAVLWALNPYLGMRTTGSFTMFSNLRTEAGAPNHLFMPSLRLTDWQDDMVTLQSSNDPALAAGADMDLSMPLVALRRMAMIDPDVTVTGVLHGRLVEWGTQEGQTRLAPLSAWEYKLLLFRPVTTDSRPFCAPS